MVRNDNGRSGPTGSQIVLHQGTQRRAVQMIKVRMRNQDDINGRQIPDAKSRTPQPFQHKQPARKVRIDHRTLPADLHKETGMANESDPQLAVRG
jgi:hypothetical protein